MGFGFERDLRCVFCAHFYHTRSISMLFYLAFAFFFHPACINSSWWPIFPSILIFLLGAVVLLLSRLKSTQVEIFSDPRNLHSGEFLLSRKAIRLWNLLRPFAMPRHFASAKINIRNHQNFWSLFSLLCCIIRFDVRLQKKILSSLFL